MSENHEEAVCAACAKQIKRLGNKPFFEFVTRDGLLQLASTLHRYGHAKSEAVIDEALVRRWGEHGADRVPSSSDIWGLCKADPAQFETAQGTRMPAAKADCPNCNGTGWKIVNRGGVEGAARCCGSPPGNATVAPIPAGFLSAWHQQEAERAERLRTGITEADFERDLRDSKARKEIEVSR